MLRWKGMSRQWRTWDVRKLADQEAHIEIVDRHSGSWGHINVDQIELRDTPLEADMTDLKQRGLLDETLVVAVGEFGRSPQRGVSTSGWVHFHNNWALSASTDQASSSAWSATRAASSARMRSTSFCSSIWSSRH